MGDLVLDWENPNTFPVTSFVAEMNGMTQGMLTRRFPDPLWQLRFVDRARGSLAPLGGRAKLTGTGASKYWKSPNIIVKLERVEVTAGTGAARTTQLVPVPAARLYGNQAIEFHQTTPAAAEVRVTALCLPSQPADMNSVVGFPHLYLWIDYAVAEMYKASQEEGPLSDDAELLGLYQYWKSVADERKFDILTSLGYELPPEEGKPKAKKR